jgi:hypothetical protein
MAIVIISVVTSLIVALVSFICLRIEDTVDNMVDLALNLESMIPNSTTFDFSEVFNFIYTIGISLIVLKFLKKGFEIYILWTDGDPDCDPIGYLTNFARAVVTATCFPFVYGEIVNICRTFLDETSEKLGTDKINLEITISATTLYTGFVMLVFLIIFVIHLFRLTFRGIELIILRAGLPFACAGLIDNDKGIFRSYVNQFTKAFISTVVQILLLKVGVAILVSIDNMTEIFTVIVGLSFMIFSLSVPKILNEFMLPQGGGGGISNTVYHSVRVFEIAGRAFRGGR